MLLARLSGAKKLEPAEAAKTLDKNNGLLARALELLGQPDARNELRVGFELLQRSLEALHPGNFLKSKPDLWLYFYEDFLAAYDPKLRKDYGVYYTPRQVVELQVRLASELLEKRFSKKLGFADDGVLFIDPALGTGTYPVAAVKHALERVRVRSGEGALPARASQMAENMYGFEILVGPYAVAHLRLSQALEGSGAKLSARLKIYLCDTLESPNASPPGGLTLTYRALTQEHEAARKVKKTGEILVCIGNPPYDREQRSENEAERPRKGGWVRFGDLVKGGAKQEEQGSRPIFDDFLEPARKVGKGHNLQVIFNDYVYFWRWALWRLFEQQNCGGIISFITAASYLSGPGFVGVREVMRRTFDELWVLDLGGDNLGARKTPNVFNIQTPVAIAMGVRGKKSQPDTPAKVWYAKIDGATREAKLAHLDGVAGLTGIEWKACPDLWHAPFLPQGQGRYFDWPKITSLFPLHTAGAVFYRAWPIAETPDVLKTRWERLAKSQGKEREKLFKQSRDRKITYVVSNRGLPGSDQPAISAIAPPTKEPNCIRYGFRSFDRQYAYYDFRLGDFIRPMLHQLASDQQLFLVSPDNLIMGKGQAIVATKYIPDQHHFRGSFGGKDVIPLYRDAAATQPNVTAGLLETLGKAYGTIPAAEDLAAYVYALLAGQSYTKRFWHELVTPGARVPVTKDGGTFAKTVRLGRRLIWLHTYAECFHGDDRGGELPAGAAKNTTPISTDPNKYPEDYEYDPEKRELRVDGGCFGPVAAQVWEFEVSGLNVVQSWLGYRMKKRAGKKSSELDDIRPERWTPKMTDELLELLWVVEATLELEPQISATLDTVVAGDCFNAAELPAPTAEERKGPSVQLDDPTQASLFEADEDADNE
jgi:predicted helicase